uniref:Uncharacterized protein n=1 Tax=Anguilla anguilla TaxID=7936 RepID=A0A0E9WXF6_ANGAN
MCLADRLIKTRYKHLFLHLCERNWHQTWALSYTVIGVAKDLILILEIKK